MDINDKESILGWYIMGMGYKPNMEFEYLTKIMTMETMHSRKVVCSAMDVTSVCDFFV